MSLAPIEWHREMLAQQAVIDEHQQLKDAIVEAAKAWRQDRFGPFELENKLTEAIAALVEFETLQEARLK